MTYYVVVPFDRDRDGDLKSGEPQEQPNARAAADAAGALTAEREVAGWPVDVRNTLVAGIALARRAEIATRNVRHFSDLDVRVVDPWAA